MKGLESYNTISDSELSLLFSLSYWALMKHKISFFYYMINVNMLAIKLDCVIHHTYTQFEIFRILISYLMHMFLSLSLLKVVCVLKNNNNAIMYN